MKAKDIILIGLICVVALVMVGYEHSDRKKTAQYRQEIAAKQDSVSLELEKLNKREKLNKPEKFDKLEKLNSEIESLKAELNSLKLSNKDNLKKIEAITKRQTPPGTQKEIRSTNPKQTGTNPKLAVVNIRYLFENCRKSADYQKKLGTEQEAILIELDNLNSEVQALRDDLNTRKVDSEDYMVIVQKMMEKQSLLEAKKGFHKQRAELKYQRWLEGFYKDILRETRNFAEQNGLDLVQVRDEIEFPALSVSDSMMAIRTQKLLYSSGSLDITNEVLARLDEEQKEQPQKISELEN